MKITVNKSRTKGKAFYFTTLLMAGYSLIYMDKSMVSTAILPISKEFHLDAAQVGMIMSIFFLGYSLMQIPSGWLADKYGAKKILLTSLSIIALFSLFFGLTNSLFFFLCIRFLVGIGHAGYPPSCSKSIADHFVQEKRTFIQALILSTSGIGSLLAFTVGANLISVDWRVAYFVLASLFLGVLILMKFFAPPDVPIKISNAKKICFKQVFTNPDVLVLSFAMLLLNFLLYGNISWLPSYLSVKFHLSIAEVGVILTINAIFQTIMMIFTGRLLSKIFLGREKSVAVSGSILAASLVIGFILADNLIISTVLLVLTTMVSVFVFTTLFTWPHKIFDPAIIGSLIGIINTGGTFGGFLAPMILGYLIKSSDGSFTVAFLSMALASILCAISILFVKRRA